MAGTQAPDWYRFKIGSIEATVVSDGVLPLGEASNLVLEAPVVQFTKPIEEQRASECVTSFAFVQAGMGASPQIEITDPVEREQCTFQASDPMQGDGETILARGRCQAAQHR